MHIETHCNMITHSELIRDFNTTCIHDYNRLIVNLPPPIKHKQCRITQESTAKPIELPINVSQNENILHYNGWSFFL